jgi:RecA/RadA recombinase
MSLEKSQKTEWVSTGVKCLDELFGGYPKRAVSLFWGDTGSCKTTMACYIPIVRTFDIKNERQRFIVIDAEGGFDWDRLIQILEANNLPVDKVLERIVVYEPTTFTQQQGYLECLMDDDKSGVAGEISKNEWQPSLIALDSAVWLAKIELGKVPRNLRPAATGDYVNDIGIQVMMLRKLAKTYNCIATVTSWDTSAMGESLGGSSEFPFLGGRNLAFIPKLNVQLINPESEIDCEELEKYENWQDIRVASLWKHRCKGRLRMTFFRVTDKGIEDLR